MLNKLNVVILVLDAVLVILLKEGGVYRDLILPQTGTDTIEG